MEKNKGLIVLVIILSLCILGLSGYIVYDKVLNIHENDISDDDGNIQNSNNNESVVQYSFGD